MSRLLLMMIVLAGAACSDGRERGEGVPPSALSDSAILADTAKRDILDRDDGRSIAGAVTEAARHRAPRKESHYAGGGMDEGSRVIPLAQLRGYRMANGTLDMRLWEVESGDGRRIGNVDELLVDTGTMEVRFLDVEVENLLATGRERHVLIPVGHARADSERSGTVVVDGLPARAVRALPTYARGTALRGGDTEYARPFAAADGSVRKGCLDFPLRVQPAPVFGAILPDLGPDAASRRRAEEAAAPRDADPVPVPGADPRAA